MILVSATSTTLTMLTRTLSILNILYALLMSLFGELVELTPRRMAWYAYTLILCVPLRMSWCKPVGFWDAAGLSYFKRRRFNMVAFPCLQQWDIISRESSLAISGLKLARAQCAAILPDRLGSDFVHGLAKFPRTSLLELLAAGDLGWKLITSTRRSRKQSSMQCWQTEDWRWSLACSYRLNGKGGMVNAGMVNPGMLQCYK